MDIVRVRKKTPDSENMIALINIIFLLLIFFMLAGTLTATDVLGVDPPESKSTVKPFQASIELLYSKRGLMALDGDVMDRATLLDTLKLRVLQTPVLEVSITADSQLKATALVDLLLNLKEIGVENLILKTELNV